MGEPVEIASPEAQRLEGEPAARVIVAGASGLAGALAARLVWQHPRLELSAVTSRSEPGVALCELHPRIRVPLELGELDLDAAAETADTAIVAYPHGAAAGTVAALRGAGLRVVDLSADFRLASLETYGHWYGEHTAPELLDGAVYGLPELADHMALAGAGLIANPGCYPTAALLALAPLAEAGLAGDVVIDAKSGVSGAGRGGAEPLSFLNVTENLTPYAIGGHRHEPEIAQGLERMGRPGGVTFVPHLVPVDQGLLASCYVALAEPLAAAELGELYRARYAGEPFVEMLERPPSIREVRETNLCRIHAVPSADGRRAIVFAAIDNLWKGAAGQAIQNLNLMLGLAETDGLT